MKLVIQKAQAQLQSALEGILSNEQRCILALSNYSVDTHKPVFKHLTKMTKFKKIELASDPTLNILERYMFETGLSLEEIDSIFKNSDV